MKEKKDSCLMIQITNFEGNIKINNNRIWTAPKYDQNKLKYKLRVSIRTR